MQTNTDYLLDLLGTADTRFIIPAYQRSYSWGTSQCEELWHDLQRAAQTQTPHFVGTLLYAQMGRDGQGFEQWVIVDGQQRLTTLTLIIAALLHYLDQQSASLLEMDVRTIRNRFLQVGFDDIASCKLVLSRNDRDTLFAIVDNAHLSQVASARIVDNLAFFKHLMAEPDFDVLKLWRGLKLLYVIDACADHTDNAQLIFESLNSKGVPLTTADLVRNFLLLAESFDEQTRLYDEYWSVIEGVFQPDPGSLRLDNAIQGWLSVRFRKVRARGASEVYRTFKRYVEEEFDGTTESLLRELRNFCFVWAENYRYHAVKKYKSGFKWATNGASTLVSDHPLKKSTNEAYHEAVRKRLAAIDVSM